MAKASQNTRKTYFYDCIRGLFNGIIYTGLMTMAILVAIRYHEAPFCVKSIIAGSESLGRLITPVGLYIGFRIGAPTGKLAAFFMLATATMLALCGFAPNLWTYATAIFLTYIIFAQGPLLMLHIYSRNYSDTNRGTRVSTMFVLSTAIGSLTSFFIGKKLDIDFSYYKYIFFIISGCGMVGAYACSKIPSARLSISEAGSPWQNISLLWRDRLFGWLTIGYIILGFANSMVSSVRIEYLANTEYAINASNLNITLINVVIPGICMIASIQLWGWIFDKIHFIKTRLLINACFMLSFLTFFFSSNFSGFIISAIFNGFALGGGMLVWHLWVTKVAPEGRAPAYMSAHGACTGIKGIVAPFLGFSLIKSVGPQSVGITASILIIISCLIFISTWNDKRIK